MADGAVEVEATIRRLYRDLELAVREGTMLVGPDGLVVGASKMMHRLGVPDDEVIGGTVVPHGWSTTCLEGGEMCLDDHPASVAARTGETVEAVVIYTSPDGQDARHLRLVAHPVTDDPAIAVDLVVGDHDRRKQTREAIEDQATRFRTLADMLPVGVYEATPTGEVTYVNPMFTTLTGLTVDETPDLPMLEIVHPDDLLSVMEAATRAPGEGEYVARYRVQNIDGTSRWVTSRMSARIDGDGQMSGFVGSISDIDELHRAEERAKRLADIVESTSDAIGAWENGSLTYLNAAAVGLLERTDPGYTNGRPSGHVFAEPLTGRYRAEVHVALVAEGRWEGEVELADSTGQPVFLSMTVTAELGPDQEIERMVVLARDIRVQKNREAVLEHVAGHDALTGLANRHHLHSASEHESAAADAVAAALYVDIDHFKRINDEHGHTGGDAVLVSVAQRLSEAVRASDIVARVGGDEIVVWAPATDAAEAEALAQRLLEAVNASPVEAGDLVVAVTVTIGLAVGTPVDMDALIRQADAALYEAKRTGRNRWKRLVMPLPD